MSNSSIEVYSCVEYLSPEDVSIEPFPHVSAADVLSAPLYDQLDRTFPPLEKMKNYMGFVGTPWGDKEIKKRHGTLSNLRVDMSALDVANDNDIVEIWKTFVQRHLTPEHFYRMVDLYQKPLQQWYPELYDKFTKGDLVIGQVHVDDASKCDILLNANVSMNSPVLEKPSRVRGPHLDINTQLFAGLLYFRDPTDNSEGGEYTLYRKTSAPRFSNNEVLDECVEGVTQVKYGVNNMAMFLNTPDSIHGVTPRSVTSYVRRFFIFSAYVRNELFDVSRYQIRKEPK